MSYRVELAKTGRATCSSTHCKKEGTKIEKADLRQGVLVPYGEHDSWKWRHWGCVTPQVIHNWKETSENNMDLVDGYDDLEPDAQAKVKRAFEQGHVDDEDWNGDIECNRYNPDKPQQGMFVKTPKKKAAKVDEEEDSDGSPVKKKKKKKKKAAAGKKRGHDAEPDDVDDDDATAEPAPKKARGRPKKAPAADDDAEPAKAPKKSKAKAATEADDEPEQAPAKKGKAKKAKATAATKSNDVEAPMQAEPAPAKKTKGKKAAAKAVNADDGDVEPELKPQKRKGRSKKAAAEEA